MKAAHAKVKSDADFPAYVQEIKELGLLHYDFLVKNGQTEYHGANGLQVNGETIYPEKVISIHSSSVAVRQIIAEHQQGKTDFFTFFSVGSRRWSAKMGCRYPGNDVYLLRFNG